MGNKRRSNFEWLRILAMAMIITLHYMFKGGMLLSAADDVSASNLILWSLTYLSICAVDAYVLISGYFLVETEFKLRRLLGLIVQILEYSLLITAVMIFTGQVSLAEIDLYSWIGYVFPIGTEEYWFITAYVFMYVLSPVLGAGAKALSERKLRIAILTLLLFTTLEKTILPMALPTDRSGYEFGWFIILYLIAAYIRLYGIKWLENSMIKSWLLYLLSVTITLLCGVGFAHLYGVTGIETFKRYSELTVDYNYLFVLTSAIGLFYIFKNARFNEDGVPASIARKLGALTLGVYLLHEHPLIRYKWQAWFKVSKERPIVLTLLNWMMCMVIIMSIGFLVEFVRRILHRLVSKESNAAATEA